MIYIVASRVGSGVRRNWLAHLPRVRGYVRYPFHRHTPMDTLLVLLLHLSSALSFLVSNPRVSFPPTPHMKFSGGLWPARRPSVFGLVGGIASGKSTVSRVLGDSCGVAVIDADKLGHESYEPGTRCFSKLVNEFGSKIVAGDGNIDRRALGEVVSPSRRKTCFCSQVFSSSRRTKQFERQEHADKHARTTRSARAYANMFNGVLF